MIKTLVTNISYKWLVIGVYFLMTYKMRTLITWKCLLSSVFSLMHYKIRFLLKHLLFPSVSYSLVYHMISSLGETLETMITWEWFHFGNYFYINCFMLDNSFIRSPQWIPLDYMYLYQSSKKIESGLVWYLFLVIYFLVSNSSIFCLAIVSSKLAMGPFGLWYASLLPYWKASLTMKWCWPFDKNKLLLLYVFSLTAYITRK